ncbi:peroxide stress protein YaaA [Muricomes intestini]
MRKKSTIAKMAREEMVRFMAENNITRVENLKGFKS